MTTMEDAVNGRQLVPLTWPPELRGDVSAVPQRSVHGGHFRRSVAAAASHRAWPAAVPIVLVNAVAFGAQLAFWRVHLPAVFQAVLVALALELIAVFLAWHAHLAQLADDSALRLRLAAYGWALLIGALNYSHYMAPGWRPTVAAVTFGMMSAISPWLWSVHSRRTSRDALKARGLIEPHAVRLGATRWTWHPYRSACVMWRATWLGETDPAKAIVLRHDSDHDKGGDKLDHAPGEDRTQDRPARGREPHRAQGRGQLRVHPPAMTKQARAAAVIRDNPGLTNAALADLAGCDIRTISRARNSQS